MLIRKRIQKNNECELSPFACTGAQVPVNMDSVLGGKYAGDPFPQQGIARSFYIAVIVAEANDHRGNRRRTGTVRTVRNSAKASS